MECPEAPQTVAGLLKKRDELTGKIEHLRFELQQLVASREHLDATILLFDDSVDFGRFRAGGKPVRVAPMGETARCMMSILRQATAPPDRGDLAKALMRMRGLDPDDVRLFQVMRTRVDSAIRRLARSGRIVHTMAGRRKVWQLSPTSPEFLVRQAAQR